jgi:hypothetical protein
VISVNYDTIRRVDSTGTARAFGAGNSDDLHAGADALLRD